jgi:hypothetical protein
MDETKTRLLLSEMVKLLTLYEVELTSYHLVLRMVENEATNAGLPFKIRENLENLASTPALHAEAEAEYATFSGLLRSASPDNLDSALAAIRRIIAHRTGRPSPD